MNFKNINKIILSVFLLYIMVILSSGCGSKGENKNREKDLTQLDTVAVQVYRASLNDIKLVKTFTGTLEGEEQANIVSKIPERIISINVHVGDNVKAGQILITLDKSGASSQFYQAQAGFLNAEKELTRMKSLYEAGAISQQMYDGTKTTYDVAKANFDAAKNTVELTSPVNGIVTSISPNIGDIANPGIPLIVVASINKMKVIFNAGEEDVTNLIIGQNVKVYSELNPDLIQKGRISQLSKSADIQSRSFELRAVFPNTSDRWFKPGMFCRVKVELKNRKNVLTIPNTSVTVIKNEKNIYVVNGNKASIRKVETGITDGNFTEILSGVKEGESVVTLGLNNLKDGNVVHISD